MSPKHAELLNVMNKINHQILCILLNYIYIYYLLLHNWLIRSDLVKCFTATHTKTLKLRSDFYVITICSATLLKATSKGTFLCFNAAFIRNVRKGRKLVWIHFLSKTATHNHTVAGDINLPQWHCSLQWHVAQQQAESVALTLWKWLRERPTIPPYTYIAYFDFTFLSGTLSSKPS